MAETMDSIAKASGSTVCDRGGNGLGGKAPSFARKGSTVG
jgi:hypothetical protein